MARQTSVVLGVGGDFTQFQNDLSRAVQNAQRTINGAKFGNPLGTISRDARDFEKSLQAASQRVIAFTASLGTLGAAASILRTIVKDTVEVEKAFTDINSVFQLSSSNLQKFSRDLFDVARQTSTSFEVAAEAAKEFSRQGLDATETLKRVRDAMILTKTSGLDVTKSVEALTATINGFNDATLDSTRIINKLVAVDQNFAVSARDLAEALSRVGSTAQDAGVSFDELIGLVTAAQQTTARGGAVIGNALKTIFTRIERNSTVEQLRDLNVQVTDLQGRALPAISILKNLATSFDNISDAAKNQAAQLIGGVFQINILRSVLKDLGKEQSLVTAATKASSAAFDEAIKRNEALNQSLDALVIKTQLTAKQIGAIIGQVSISDKAKDLLGALNNNFLVDAFKNINTADVGVDYGRTIGENIAGGIEGALRGIGNVIAGPAVFYAGRIMTNVAKKTFGTFGGDIAQLAGIGSQSSAQRQTLEQINALYASGDMALQRQLATARSLTEQINVMASAISRANVAGYQTNVTSQIMASGVLSARRSGNFASGYLSNYVQNEYNAIASGRGGVTSNAKPVIIPGFNFGNGEIGTAVGNTGEYIVKGASGHSIFNPDMIAKFGLPPGARKIGAADGYIPSGALRSGGFGNTPKGAYVSGAQFNSLFEQLTSSKSWDDVIRLKIAIGDLTKEMEKFGNISANSAETVRGVLKSTWQDLIQRRSVFRSGFNFYGEKGVVENVPDTSAFDQISIGGQIGGGGSGGMGAGNPGWTPEYIKRTFAEKYFKRNFGDLRESDLQKSLVGPGNYISDNDRFIAEQSLRREMTFDVAGKGYIRGFNVDSSASAARTLMNGETLKEQYIKTVQNLIRGGNSFENAAKEALQELKRETDSRKKVNSIYRSTLPSLIVFEKEIADAIQKRATTQNSAQFQLNRIATLRGVQSDFLSGGYDKLNPQQKILFQQNLREQARQNLGLGQFSIGQIRANAAISSQFQDEVNRLMLSNGASGGPAPINPFGILQKNTGGFWGGLFAERQGRNIVAASNLTGVRAEEIMAAARMRQTEARQRTAFGLSFALPFAAGFLPQGKSGETSGLVSGTLGGAAQLGSIGLATMNPWLTGAGFLIGGAHGFISRMNKSFEELAKEIEDANAKSAEQINSASNFSRLDEAIRSASLSGASSQEINALVSQQKMSFSNISDSSLRRKFLEAQGDIGAQEKIRVEMAQKAGMQSAAGDITSALSRANGPLSRFFGFTELNSANFGSTSNAIQVALQRGIAANGPQFGKDIISLGKTDPKEALRRLGVTETSDAKAKDLTDAFAAAAKNLSNFSEQLQKLNLGQINFTRELNKAAQDIANRAEYMQRETLGKIETRNILTEGAISLFGGTPELTAQLQGQNTLKRISQTGQANFEGALGKIKKTLITTAIKNNLEGLTPQIAGVDSISGILGLSQFTGSNSEMAKAIQEAVVELEAINQNTRLESEKTEALIQVNRLQLMNSQKNAILSNAKYSNDTRYDFERLKIGARTPFGQNPEAERANAILEQLNTLKSMGIPDTTESLKLREDMQKISARAALTSLKGLGANPVIEQQIQKGLTALDFDGRQFTNLGANRGIGPLASSSINTQSSDIFANILRNANNIAKSKLDRDQAMRAQMEQTFGGLKEKNISLAAISALSQRRASNKLVAGKYGQEDRSESEFREIIGPNIDELFRTNGKMTISRARTANKLADEFVSAFLNNTLENLVEEAGKPDSKIYQFARESPNVDATQFKDVISQIILSAAVQMAPTLFQKEYGSAQSASKSSISQFISKTGTPYATYTPTTLAGLDIYGKKFTSFYGSGSGVQFPQTSGIPYKTPAQDSLSAAALSGIVSNINSAQKSLDTGRARKDLDEIIKQLDIIYQQQVKMTAFSKNQAQDSFLLGFAHHFDILKEKAKDFSDVGAQVASSLETGLGNAFGNFTTGAMKAKDAFRSFAVNVFADASRAFASKAVQGLLGAMLGGLNIPSSGLPGGRTYALGGIASGKTPSLLTAGEVVIPKEAASSLGYDSLLKMNGGGVDTSGPGYAYGGIVKGGSGVRDDVFAMLRPGDFVMKKSAVQKFGSENLLEVVKGARVQKRFLGGLILGALLGGGIGYATGGKKGAIIGAIGGGLLGGFAQNYMQTGSLLKSAPNAGLFSFSRATPASLQIGAAPSGEAPINPAEQPTGSGSPSSAKSTPQWKSTLIGMGASAALGGISSLFAPKQTVPSNILPSMSIAQIEASRKATEKIDAENLSKGNGFLVPVEKDGFIVYERAMVPATRRFATGGIVPMNIGNSSTTPISLASAASLPRFAQGAGTGNLNIGSSSPMAATLSAMAMLPRFGSSNGVPSLLTGGEAIIPREVVQSLGPRRFADGGFVGAPTFNMGDKGGNSMVAGDININVTMNSDGSTTRNGNDANDNQMGNNLAREIESAVVDVLNRQTRQGGVLYQAYGTSRLAS